MVTNTYKAYDYNDVAFA